METDMYPVSNEFRVEDGIRTHGLQSHNLTL
jgi:hypothetical protein